MQSSTTKLTILKYVLVNSLHVQYSVYASGVLCARAAQHAALGELLGGRAVELAQTLADDLSRVHARVCTNSTHALAHDAPPPHCRASNTACQCATSAFTPASYSYSCKSSKLTWSRVRFAAQCTVLVVTLAAWLIRKPLHSTRGISSSIRISIRRSLPISDARGASHLLRVCASGGLRYAGS